MDVARELLAAGADISAGDQGGRSPLHLAALQVAHSPVLSVYAGFSAPCLL